MLGTSRCNNKFGTKSSSVVSSVRLERVSLCTYAGTEDATSGDEVNFKGLFLASVFSIFGATEEIRDVTPKEFYQNGF